MTSVVVEEDEDRVNMTISTDNCVDMLGQYVPAGNYYFTATHFLNNMVCGNLFQKGEWGEFCFENKQLIRMMAIAQARLNRRVRPSIPDERMPRYNSPPTSPIRAPPRRLTPPRPPSPPMCSICYDGVMPGLEKRLPCQHLFHKSCIDTWLHRKANCPLCRAAVPRSLPRIHRRRYPPTITPNNNSNMRIRSMAYDRYRRRNGSIL